MDNTKAIAVAITTDVSHSDTHSTQRGQILSLAAHTFTPS